MTSSSRKFKSYTTTTLLYYFRAATLFVRIHRSVTEKLKTWSCSGIWGRRKEDFLFAFYLSMYDHRLSIGNAQKTSPRKACRRPPRYCPDRDSPDVFKSALLCMALIQVRPSSANNFDVPLMDGSSLEAQRSIVDFYAMLDTVLSIHVDFDVKRSTKEPMNILI